jgi:2-oxoacid:acceptor oxidoreductase delta subunit (pyruvate/2-ketoisovalerate family)
MKKLAGDNKRKRRLYGPVALIFSSVNTGSWRIFRPFVDESHCVKCGWCKTFCPTDVIEVYRDEGIEEVVAIDWNYCKGCGICADICPKKCIRMVKEND